MHIIQSYWACNNKSLLTANAGWYAPEYNLISSALSCLQLKKYYNNLTLYADSGAAELLVDKLKLPYSEVKCELDRLGYYPQGLWAIPKIYAYSQQDAPFLHCDNDVFIWEAFNKGLMDSDVIVQNKEAGTAYYEAILTAYEKKLTYFPVAFKEQREKSESVFAYNMGIFGGRDTTFFKHYCSEAFQFVNKNIDSLSSPNESNFNIVFEQYLLFCLAEKLQKPVSVMLNDVIEDLGYTGFGDFANVPHQKRYLHLIGIYKRNPIVCNQMAFRLRQDYPDYYYRIIQLFRNSNSPLKKDYYYWLGPMDEPQMVDRYKRLKTTDVKKGGPDEKDVVEFVSERTLLIKEYFHHNSGPVSRKLAKILEADIFKIENCIGDIVKDKFSQLDKNELYKRDILSSHLSEKVFAKTDQIYDNQLVACNWCELVDAKFDWMLLADNEHPLSVNIKKIIESRHQYCKLAVVPECDKKGYTLTGLDGLDVFIFQLLKEPMSIETLFKKLSLEFDEEELTDARNEFEILIFGRLKKAFLDKTIKGYQE